MVSLLRHKYKKKTVTKQDLVDGVFIALRSRGTPLTYAIVEDIITTFFADIGDAMVNGSIVEIRGFGVFRPFNLMTRYRPEAMATLPTCKGRMLPAKKIIINVFKPSKLLVAKINGARDELFTQYLDGDDAS